MPVMTEVAITASGLAAPYDSRMPTDWLNTINPAAAARKNVRATWMNNGQLLMPKRVPF